MVTIATVRETAGEPRTALSPETVKKFAGKGCRVVVESGAGLGSRFSDEVLKQAGAEIVGTAAEALSAADILLKVRRPSAEEAGKLKTGAIVAAMVEPYGDRAGLEAMASAGSDRLLDGADAAHLARAIDGRAVEPGQPRRLQGRRRCGLDVRAWPCR